VGALIYALPCVRMDAAQSIALEACVLTFPTHKLLELAQITLLYMAQTADVQVVYRRDAPDGDRRSVGRLPRL